MAIRKTDVKALPPPIAIYTARWHQAKSPHNGSGNGAPDHLPCGLAGMDQTPDYGENAK